LSKSMYVTQSMSFG